MINTQENDQTILTTIPYDKGWKVYVDGESVETYEALDALMAFDIENNGEHLLELKYAPTEYTVGIIISICGIAAFIVICLIDFILKKTLLKNKLRTYAQDYFVLDDIDNEDAPNAIEALESNLDGDGKEDECEEFSTPEADGFEPFDSNENTEE
jgi:hypothetical protein